MFCSSLPSCQRPEDRGQPQEVKEPYSFCQKGDGEGMLILILWNGPKEDESFYELTDNTFILFLCRP